MARPGWDEYYLGIARAVAVRSNCVRRQVGALIVVDNAIIATGYNGTPVGVRNCIDGGCPRCAADAPTGAVYDSCICVHAEQSAIVFAARHGNATQGGKTCSIGFAAFPFLADPAALTWSQVVGIADRALYAAKKTQRDAWIGLSATGGTRAEGLEADLAADPAGAITSRALHVATSIPDDRPLVWS